MKPWAKFRVLCVDHIKWQVSFYWFNSRVRTSTLSPSRSNAAHVSVCGSKTISFVKLAQTNHSWEPRILPVSTKIGPSTQKVLRGEASALNAFSILRNVEMFLLPCQETSFCYVDANFFSFIMAYILPHPNNGPLNRSPRFSKEIHRSRVWNY